MVLLNLGAETHVCKIFILSLRLPRQRTLLCHAVGRYYAIYITLIEFTNRLQTPDHEDLIFLIAQVTLSRWLRHNVGRVGSSEGNCSSCHLYSSGHYWWTLKLPGVLSIRKKDIRFAFLSSFISITCDLYLTFSCKREFPTKRCWNIANPLASRPCFLQNILAGLKTKECFLNGSNGKDLLKFYATIDEFVWKIRDVIVSTVNFETSQ